MVHISNLLSRPRLITQVLGKRGSFLLLWRSCHAMKQWWLNTSLCTTRFCHIRLFESTHYNALVSACWGISRYRKCIFSFMAGKALGHILRYQIARDSKIAKIYAERFYILLQRESRNHIATVHQCHVFSILYFMYHILLSSLHGMDSFFSGMKGPGKS